MAFTAPLSFDAMAESPMSAAPTGSRKEQLLEEFNTIVAETERLLKTVTPSSAVASGPAGGEPGALEPAGAGTTLDENLKAARERLEQLEDLVLQRSKAAAQATDTYVRAHPWQAVGIAAGIGLVIGLLLRRR
jgi:ElaB/YqjD/DUF883 family membrane-anchored ribosome-binding protein